MTGGVWTTEHRAVAAGLSVDLDRWRREFDALMLRVGGRFARVEPRRRVASFVRGLLAGLSRVNCWLIAEHVGEDSPRGMQRLLSAAVWDEAGSAMTKDKQPHIAPCLVAVIHLSSDRTILALPQRAEPAETRADNLGVGSDG